MLQDNKNQIEMGEIKMKFYEINIYYQRKFIVAFVQSLYEKNQLYEVLERIYDDAKNVHINTIPNKTVYNGLIKNHGMYTKYKSRNKYMMNVYHYVAQ